MAKRLRPGFYRVQLNSTTWEVPERYQDLKLVNSGAYGVVCSALDNEYNIRVAIKKLHAPFDHHHQAKKSYRELKILSHMKHRNCIGLLDVFTPSETPEDFSDFYMVMPFMTIDLAQLLKENRSSRCNIFGEEHIQFFLYQILCGLKYVHSAGLIHRDLKPSNIAIDPSCELRLLDFGLARPTGNDMTGYVSTRYYRAPEIVLNWKHYDKQVDLWSVGCIMAEMLSGYVLFPGDNQIDQLYRIFEIMGTPSKELISKIPNEKTRLYLESLKPIAPRNIGNMLGITDYTAVDLIKKLLVIDPDSRITIDEALSHPYFADIADPDYETTAIPYNDDFEALELEAKCWKDLVWKEIANFKTDLTLYSQLLEDMQ